MNVRNEQLKLAAVAAGIDIENFGDWNPFDDSADALDLAVRLSMDIHIEESKISVSCKDKSVVIDGKTKLDNPNQSLRWAITQCAIGTVKEWK